MAPEDVQAIHDGMARIAQEIADLRVTVAGKTISRDEYDRDKDRVDDIHQLLHDRISGQRTDLEGVKARMNRYAGAIGVILGIVLAAVPFLARAF